MLFIKCKENIGFHYLHMAFDEMSLSRLRRPSNSIETPMTSIKTPSLFILGLITLISCNNYKGTPFEDAVYKSGTQEIPGRLQLEYYDLGGEGTSYHDSDSTNSGSGALNPVDGSYLHSFRIDEPVDISFTKQRGVDNSPYNFVEPEFDQLYVGWTEAGEWTKYTVDVKTKGTYKVGLMYTARHDGQIAIAINDKDVTGPLDVPSTYVAADTIAWRQWHHWNYLNDLADIELEKGLQTLTLHTVAVGQMNYDFISLELKAEK
jgi:hypothetical protein